MVQPEESERGSPSSGGDPTIATRKERGAIAAQACETCRSRKQKCDEKRPKCSTCVRFQLPCSYREPQPTKKDRTLTEILEHIRIVEGRFDVLENKIDAIHGSNIGQAGRAGGLSFPGLKDPRSHRPSGSNSGPRSPTSLRHGSTQLYVYESATHKALGWLSHKSLWLGASVPSCLDPSLLDRTGRAVALGLPVEKALSPPGTASPLRAATPSHSDYLPVTPKGTPSILPTHQQSLTVPEIASAFMGLLNPVCPVLDGRGYDSGLSTPGQGIPRSPPVHGIVMALGRLAIETFRSNQDGVGLGPGVRVSAQASFDEALRQSGIVSIRYSLETVQALILTSIYGAILGDPNITWVMNRTASTTCQALRQLLPYAAASPQVRLVRRCAWQCAITETYYNLELDLPPPDLFALAEEIGLPEDADVIESDDSATGAAFRLSQDIFLAQAHLALHAVRVHHALRGALSDPFVRKPGVPGQGQDAEFANVINNLATSVRSWHESLPPHLSWPDDDPHANQPPASLGYPVAVLTALLRTRYHYVLHLIYRPFLYRVINNPNPMQVPSYVAEGVMNCLTNCLRWPVVYLSQAPVATFSPAVSPTRRSPTLSRTSTTTPPDVPPRPYFDPIRHTNIAQRSSPTSSGASASASVAAAQASPGGPGMGQPLAHLLLAGAGGAAWHSTRMVVAALAALCAGRRSEHIQRIRTERGGRGFAAAESESLSRYCAWVDGGAAATAGEAAVDTGSSEIGGDGAARWAWMVSNAMFGGTTGWDFAGEESRFGGERMAAAGGEPGPMDQD